MTGDGEIEWEEFRVAFKPSDANYQIEDLELAFQKFAEVFIYIVVCILIHVCLSVCFSCQLPDQGSRVGIR